MAHPASYDAADGSLPAEAHCGARRSHFRRCRTRAGAARRRTQLQGHAALDRYARPCQVRRARPLCRLSSQLCLAARSVVGRDSCAGRADRRGADGGVAQRPCRQGYADCVARRSVGATHPVLDCQRPADPVVDRPRVSLEGSEHACARCAACRTRRRQDSGRRAADRRVVRGRRGGAAHSRRRSAAHAWRGRACARSGERRA